MINTQKYSKRKTEAVASKFNAKESKFSVRAAAIMSLFENQKAETCCSCDRCDKGSCPCRSKCFSKNYNLIKHSGNPARLTECHRSCECHKNKKTAPMKLHYINNNVGYGVVATGNIAAGQNLTDYVGIVGFDECFEKESNYMFNLDPIHKTLKQEQKDKKTSSKKYHKKQHKNSKRLIPQKRSKKNFPEQISKEKYQLFNDAAEYGNWARFFNHSCSPNVYSTKVSGFYANKDYVRIVFFSSKTIKAGEELCIDYDPENIATTTTACHCGSPKCKGKMIKFF